MNLVKSSVAELPPLDLRLTPEELSDLWKGRISVGTLANWRVLGKGPKFMKIGREVFYPLSEVLSYEQSQTKSSTSHFAR